MAMTQHGSWAVCPSLILIGGLFTGSPTLEVGDKLPGAPVELLRTDADALSDFAGRAVLVEIFTES